MTRRFVVALSRGKDDPDRATVAFTLANAAVGSDQETVVFLSSEGVRLAVDGYADDVAEKGFSPLKQLMTTFESARIQTAARGVGVAQAALEDAVQYAWERTQFGKPIVEFPRVSRKIGRLVAQVQAARQLTLFAAREKDGDIRCDLEAGMAKLLATRTAWEAADANVQIHGGNGFA